MKVFTCTGFEGHYPVGTAAVVVADNEAEARDQLVMCLALNGLPQDRPLEIKELSLAIRTAVILNDGNY